MIRIVKVKKVTDTPETPPGFININTLSWFPNNILDLKEVISSQKLNNIQSHLDEKIPLYELTPYYLRTKEGYIFENYWQGSKIFRHLYPQKQIYSSKVTWNWEGEYHMDSSGYILPAYWKWRKSLMENSYPVRYPNGYEHRNEVLAAIWFNPKHHNYEAISYIEARKKIYCREYANLVRKTSAFASLSQLLKSEVNLQIYDVDIPGNMTLVPRSYAFEMYSDFKNINCKRSHLNCSQPIRELSEFNLSNSNLSDSNLSDSNLSDSNLSDSSLSDSNLSDSPILDSRFSKRIKTKQKYSYRMCESELLYQRYLYNTNIPFGHSWTLAALLLNYNLDFILE